MYIAILSIIYFLGQVTFAYGFRNETIPSFTVRLLQERSLFAAEVLNIDLESITKSDFDALHKCLLTHKVLVLRGQSGLTVEAQRSFTRRFGTLDEHVEESSHLPGYRDVNVISNMVNNRNGLSTGLSGKHVEQFHSDLSWAPIPTQITFLVSKVLPSKGGDTHFADSTAAYDDLSSHMKTRLHDLKSRHSYLKHSSNESSLLNDKAVQTGHMHALKLGSEHPLVSTHPDTGRMNIFANAADSEHVMGVSSVKSEEILNFLFAQVEKEKYRYVHKWQTGDALLWDNRATQHRASSSPGAAAGVVERTLIRTTASAPVPSPGLVLSSVSSGSSLSHSLAVAVIAVAASMSQSHHINS